VVRRFDVVGREKSLTLEWMHPDPDNPVKVLANAEGIDRIFNNLISNAIKYTPAQGRVSVSLVRCGEHVQVEVADTGIGIPPEAMEHLFEEFYRAPNARSIEHEGTGLGLTIARDLAARYGGSIKVESALDSGTRFIVTFPLVHPS
jgi:two-component system phosphate regulon sensor histidine kinase PhoR